VLSVVNRDGKIFATEHTENTERGLLGALRALCGE